MPDSRITQIRVNPVCRTSQVPAELEPNPNPVTTNQIYSTISQPPSYPTPEPASVSCQDSSVGCFPVPVPGENDGIRSKPQEFCAPSISVCQLTAGHPFLQVPALHLADGDMDAPPNFHSVFSRWALLNKPLQDGHTDVLGCQRELVPLHAINWTFLIFIWHSLPWICREIPLCHPKIPLLGLMLHPEKLNQVSFSSPFPQVSPPPFFSIFSVLFTPSFHGVPGGLKGE